MATSRLVADNISLKPSNFGLCGPIPEVQTKPTFRATTCFARCWGAVSKNQSSKRLHNHMRSYLLCGYNIRILLYHIDLSIRNSDRIPRMGRRLLGELLSLLFFVPSRACENSRKLIRVFKIKLNYIISPILIYGKDGSVCDFHTRNLPQCEFYWFSENLIPLANLEFYYDESNNRKSQLAGCVSDLRIIVHHKTAHSVLIWFIVVDRR